MDNIAGRSDEHTQSFHACHGVWQEPRTAKKTAMGRLIHLWCILGDFNTILCKEDRLGGDAVTDQDTKELSQFMDQCELIEMRSIGLSDRTPLIIQFPSSPKPQASFKCCDIWALTSCDCLCPYKITPMQFGTGLSIFIYHEASSETLIDIQTALQATPGVDHLLEKERELRKRYIEILSSSISLLKQQCKMARIKYGDDNIRLFFAKAKQRKLATYIYTLKDDNGQIVKVNLQKSQVVLRGVSTALQDLCLQETGLEIGQLTLRYLGIRITASRLTKTECTALIDKILAKVHIWATRSISFAGRAALINSSIFGMFSYWASIFLLPSEVVERIAQICQNYLWSGSQDFTKPPYALNISQTETRQSSPNWYGQSQTNRIPCGSNRFMNDTSSNKTSGAILLPMTVVGIGKNCVKSRNSSSRDVLFQGHRTGKARIHTKLVRATNG
ncbi:hypothetical protein Cgig2_024357 [Carnegiea gigantea]|uniref:Uncharacterized protein n=1 Tax=Carnegiea gigantea TaxID=171969 RepID=A0A9Q1JI11_9CARY|nr:hypothetical protein Cgig2_024357 [Carnegiea gigantea]